MFGLRALSVAFLIAFAVGEAHAANVVAIPANIAPSIRYPVSGTIVAACSFSQGARDVRIIGLADPDDDTVRHSQTDLPFAIDCNAPVRVVMQSSNGGLLHAGAATSDPDFSNLVAYNATVHLPNSAAALSCRSHAMGVPEGCRTTTLNSAGSGDGRITVSVPSADRLLLAGRYRDRLTVTITPIIGGERD